MSLVQGRHLGLLATTLLYLLFDIQEELNQRLSAIEAQVVAPKVEEFQNFTNATARIKDSIFDVLMKGRDLHVCFLVVSGRYSWRFVEDHAEQFLAALKKKKQMVLDVCLIDPATLGRHGLHMWGDESRNTKERITKFQSRFEKELRDGRIILNIYWYDNIPHWHGILINNKTFFMGRTDWAFGNELKVGQIEYRLFFVGDGAGGDVRIERFKNWFEYYKQRGEKLSQEQDRPGDREPRSEAPSTPVERDHTR